MRTHVFKAAIQYSKRYLSIILCLMFSAILLASAADDVDRESQRLHELKRSRDAVKRKKSGVLSEEKSVRAELEKIGKHLASKKRELRIYELNLARCERDIKQLEKALAEAERRSKQTQSMMVKRLRAMYKFGYAGGQLSYLKLLLGSDSVSDLMSKYKYMSAIASADMALLEKATAEKAEIDSKKKLVEARKKRILYYKAGAERIKKDVLSKSRTRKSTLARLQKSEKHLTRRLNELEESVDELEYLIVRLRNNSEKIPYEELINLEEKRGRLRWPVSGKIVKNSAPSMKGVTVQTKYGTDIRCVASGTVEYADWFDGVGFGQMVIIDHGSGYRTLYAHASELLVTKGQRVNNAQIIAKVGDTGSLRGSMLYFEIWKGTKAMSTRQWLR